MVNTLAEIHLPSKVKPLLPDILYWGFRVIMFTGGTDRQREKKF